MLEQAVARYTSKEGQQTDFSELPDPPALHILAILFIISTGHRFWNRCPQWFSCFQLLDSQQGHFKSGIVV
jgi:hypothetical protein